MASIKRRTQQQQAIWEDFAKYSPATFATVKDGLSKGQNYVVVLGDKISAGATFSDKDPHALASSLQAEMVHSSGIPLPVDSEGRSVFAFLVWKNTDPIDAPSEIEAAAVVHTIDALAESLRGRGRGNRDSLDMKSLPDLTLPRMVEFGVAPKGTNVPLSHQRAMWEMLAESKGGAAPDSMTEATEVIKTHLKSGKNIVAVFIDGLDRFRWSLLTGQTAI